jgi:hypothetical protein
MSKRKPALWLIVVILVVIVVIGIAFLNLTHLNVIDLINKPARYLVPKHSESYEKILLNIMADEMDQFPQIISSETMEKEGVVSILHGTMFDKTSSLFDDFVANVSEGKAAQVKIAVYTTEGDPIYKNVLFDHVQYIAVIDNSHDRFRGECEDNEIIRYDYLRIITAPETGSKFVILTNDSELTFEQLKIAQIESDMESIDSYQLFSYSE